MISKIFKSQVATKKTSGLIYAAFRGFANAEAPKETPKTNIDDVVNTDKAAKDAQYEEMAFKFEREWKKIYDERNTRQIAALSEELSEVQRKRVDLLAQALLELNIFELRYFSAIIRDKVWKTTGVNPLKINLDWPSIKQLEDGSWPPANPNWFMQQEAISKLWPMGVQGFAQLFGGAAFGGAGGAPVAGAGAAPQQAQAEVKEEKKEEPKAEKTNFDIELAAVDANQKIKIIKEVRQILNLGLKEAKEMVEKTPVTLKKGVKKDEAEKIKEVLVACGCTINLL